jgi:L-fuconolactonase
MTPSTGAALRIVDAHVHCWDVRRLDYPWLAAVPALRGSYLPGEYRAACGATTIEAMVFVECGCEASQNLEEVCWVEELARAEPRLRAVIAHASLERGVATREDLSALAGHALVRGVRRNLQGEPEADFCLRPDFVTGVNLLAEFHFVFEICCTHPQLPAVAELVRRCPKVRFIVDHAGKPGIRQRILSPWQEDLRALAALPNVVCKLSGLATEADLRAWRPEDLKPYIDWVLDCFGWDRVLFGSDWPVSTLATDYSRWVETILWAANGATPHQLQQLFSGNAEREYGLGRRT